MKNNYLSEREMNVMQVLWKYEKPMTVTEIVESEKELTTPTVHTVLRKLLDKGYVQVIDTVQTGKVFARRYKAKKTQDEEIEEKIEKCMKNSRNPMSFVNTEVWPRTLQRCDIHRFHCQRLPVCQLFY